MPVGKGVWPGWIGSLPADGTKYRLTWAEWSEWEHQHPQGERAPEAAVSPSYGPREVASRSFLQWFDAAAKGRADPPFDDRELAGRKFMRAFDDIVAALQREPRELEAGGRRAATPTGSRA